MTHEYVIAVGGRVRPDPTPDHRATAIGWAAEAVLAIGADAEVRAISRGDSSFLDLAGATVTAMPTDPDRARAVVASMPEGTDVVAALLDAGLLDASRLEVGAPADFAFWSTDGLLAEVRAGAFTEGDEHFGPFSRAP